MYAPSPYDPPVDLKRSISGYVRDSEAHPVDSVAITAKHDRFVTGTGRSEVCVHYAVTGKEGFYYVELTCMPASERLDEDENIGLIFSKYGFDDKSASVVFTKAGQEEHIENDAVLEAKAAGANRIVRTSGASCQSDTQAET